MADELQERFQTMKTRFDTLAEELRKIHADWRKIHDKERDLHTQARHDTLIDRESKVFEELRQLLASTEKILAFKVRQSNLSLRALSMPKEEPSNLNH